MSRKKKILILSVSAGAGHLRAAEALAETAKRLKLPVTTHHEDVLSFTSPLFRKIYSRIHYAIVDKSPELWGYLYRRTRTKGPALPQPQLLRHFNEINYKKYLSFLDAYSPDAVICTHFLPYAAIAAKINVAPRTYPFFAVTTDYDIHSLWVNPLVSGYFVATKETAWILKSHGIERSRIVVSGIPVLPQFGDAPSRKSARKAEGLSPDAFTIMILAGGHSTTTMQSLIDALIECLTSELRRTVQIILVCGRNEPLYHHASKFRHGGRVKVKAYRHVSFIDRLMSCSDLLITKSGGLTVSEALAKHLPMIIFDPFPGQEGQNSTYLAEHEVAVSASTIPQLLFKVCELAGSPSRLRRLRTSAARIAAPDAAERIWKEILRRC